MVETVSREDGREIKRRERVLWESRTLLPVVRIVPGNDRDTSQTRILRSLGGRQTLQHVAEPGGPALARRRQDEARRRAAVKSRRLFFSRDTFFFFAPKKLKNKTTKTQKTQRNQTKQEADFQGGQARGGGDEREAASDDRGVLEYFR